MATTSSKSSTLGEVLRDNALYLSSPCYELFGSIRRSSWWWAFCKD